MADKDEPQDPTGPSLELPSLGFGRKKKRDRRDADDTAAPTAPRPESQPPEPAPEPEPAPAPAPAPPPEPEPAPAMVTPPPAAVEPEPVAEPAADTPEPEARRPARPRLPQLGGVPAACVAGLVAGLLVVGLVWASQGVCELARGTSSCGDAGFLLLLASLVVAGWLGGALLRGFGVADGASTSFLALGLVAVVMLLFLGGQLFTWWMVVVVPVVAVAAFVLSHRVTTAMVEPAGREMHR